MAKEHVIIINKQATTFGDDKYDPKKSNVVEGIESQRDEISGGFEQVHQSSPIENNMIEESETILIGMDELIDEMKMKKKNSENECGTQKM